MKRKYIILKAENALKPRNKLIKSNLLLMQDQLFGLLEPVNFNPHDPTNVEKLSESAFEEAVNVIEDQGTFDPKKLTVYSFYEKIKYLNKKFEHKPN